MHPYRKDIQILRGISVLLVVFFHLGIAGFGSGFLGVDVFFVISGYLMYLLYKPSHKLEFFAKRAKRLLPPYFVVILATLLVSAVLTTPLEYNGVAKQAVFATGFLSNFWYWYESSYFSKDAFNPLLHLWSLAVEIQFYLIVPLLFWLFKKFKASYFVLLLGSLLACFYIVGISPKTSFFMMPLRLWEFLLGYGVAERFSHYPKSKHTYLGTVSLLVLMAIPILSIDGEALSFLHGHPGIYALITAIATAIILIVGIPAGIERLSVATLLEKIGRYSYSIYLVHFPVIVFMLYQPFAGTDLKSDSYIQTLTIIGTICFLSILMYYFVENPLRSHQKTSRYLLTFSLAVLILAPLGMLSQRLRYSEKELMIFQAWTDRDPYRCGKLKRLIQPGAISCELTQALKNPQMRILLVGNSHADAIKAGFAKVAQSRNVSVRFMVENTPLMAGGVSPEGLINEAKSRNIDALVLHYSPKSISYSTVEHVVELAKNNDIAVSFLMPVPVWQEHIPQALWEHIKYQDPLPQAFIQDYYRANQQLSEALLEIEAKNFRIYQAADSFCQTACKIINESGKPLYFDDGHLTLSGSALLLKVFEEIISHLHLAEAQAKSRGVSKF